jgi:hypothetical protein
MCSKKKIAHGIIGTKGGKMGVTLLFRKTITWKELQSNKSIGDKKWAKGVKEFETYSKLSSVELTHVLHELKSNVTMV